MITKKHADFVGKMIGKYGPTINLEERPEQIIEIIRTFGPIMDNGDGGVGCGGVGTPPPCEVAEILTFSDMMRAISGLRSEILEIKQMIKTG